MLVNIIIPIEEVEKIPLNIIIFVEKISPKDNYTRKTYPWHFISPDGVKCQKGVKL
jgi:hypothetical protein